MSGFIIEPLTARRPAAPALPKAPEPGAFKVRTLDLAPASPIGPAAPQNWWRRLLWPTLPPAQLAAIEKELGPWKPILAPYDFFRAGQYWIPLRAMCPIFFVAFVQFTMLPAPTDIALMRRVVENSMSCKDCRAVAAVQPSRQRTVVRAEPVSTVLITLPLLGEVALPGVVVSSF
jgi:hypothetical protein